MPPIFQQEGVAGLNPYVCVLYVGNNELSKGKEAVEVAAGIQAILKALHFFLPNTEFLIVGLLPRADDVYFSAVRPFTHLPRELMNLEGFGRRRMALERWTKRTLLRCRCSPLAGYNQNQKSEGLGGRRETAA